jgi:hypothetical protein
MKRILLSAAFAAVCLVALAVAQPAMAQSGNTWKADYYYYPDLTGYVRTEYPQMIWFDWGYGAPSGLPADNWSARFTTDAFFNEGTYQFMIQADDEFVLYIDGAQRYSTVGQGQANKPQYLNLWMGYGNHYIEIIYHEVTVTASIFVNWSFVSGGGTPPPPPPPANVPPLPPDQAPPLVTDYGDYTYCMQQNIHQVNCFGDGYWDLNSNSVASERQIESWTRCTADQTGTYLDSNGEAKSYNCSKTQAGWFPND